MQTKTSKHQRPQLKKPKNAINPQDMNRKMTLFFISFFAINSLILLIFCMATQGNSLSWILFSGGKTQDQFMDFLNSIRDSAQRDVYNGRGSIYPPLSVLYFRFIALFIDNDIVGLSFRNRRTIWSDQRSMLMVVFFISSSMLIINKMISKKFTNKTNRLFAEILSAQLIFSYPMLYAIERGNIIILTMMTSMFFFFYRNSENKVLKELSYIMLAVSAGLKYYPAVFGLILIREKKFKDALRLMLYGISAIAIPLVLIKYFDTKAIESAAALANVQTGSVGVLPAKIGTGSQGSFVSSMIKNLVRFFNKKSSGFNASSVSIYNFAYFFKNTNKAFANTMSTFLLWTSEILALISFFIVKKEWERVFLLCYLIINIPAASSVYSLIFLIIPLVMFILEPNKKKSDWFFLILFAFLLTPIPTWLYAWDAQIRVASVFYDFHYDRSLNKLCGSSFTQAMFFGLVIRAIVTLLSSDKKSPSEPSQSIEEAVEVAESVEEGAQAQEFAV